MREFFSYTGKGYEGQITITQTERIIPIILSLIIIVLLMVFGRRLRQWKYELQFRKFMGYFLLAIWSSYYIWNFAYGKLNSTSLPVSLCSLTSIGFIVVYLFNNKKSLDIVFYWGIIGGLLALLFVNDVYRGIEHYRYYEFYFDHTIIFISPFYFMFVNSYIPTIKTTFLSFISLLLTALLVLPINLVYNMDYMIMNPYTAPIGTPAYLIASFVQNNLFLYIGILIILGTIVYSILYYFMKMLSFNLRNL